MNTDKLVELLNAEAEHWRNLANTLAIEQHRTPGINASRIAAFHGREEGFTLAIAIVRKWAEQSREED